MELRQLRYLDRIVATGGFRSAARELGITQPTLTVQVRLLERDLGFRLLDRSRRPIQTTPAGHRILLRVRELLALLDELNDDATSIASTEAGYLRLGANQWAASLLPPMLAEFAKRHPNIDVLLHQCTTRDTRRLILRGELDLCLLALRSDFEHLPGQLESARLFSFEHVFAVPADHRLADRGVVQLCELANERLLISRGTSGTMLQNALTEAGVTAHIAVATTDAELVTSFVAQGMGIGFTPDFLAEAHASRTEDIPRK